MFFFLNVFIFLNKEIGITNWRCSICCKTRFFKNKKSLIFYVSFFLPFVASQEQSNVTAATQRALRQASATTSTAIAAATEAERVARHDAEQRLATQLAALDAMRANANRLADAARARAEADAAAATAKLKAEQEGSFVRLLF